MTRRAATLWAAAATLSLGVAPVFAGQAKERPESRPATGSSSGTAVSRPSGGESGGSSGGSSAGSSSSSGASSSSMPSGGGSRTDSEFSRPRAPERRSNDRAVARGENRPAASGRSSGTAASAPDNAGDQRRAVPAYSRPRDGRPATGAAVGREFPPIGGGNGNVIFYPYYDPFYGYGYGSRYGYSGYYGPWFAGYGFGLGYFYDPWGYNYYSPYDSGYGYSRYAGSRYDRYGRRDVGQLRLKVKPSNGQVYVDGYFVGEVDSFDGVMQRLSIEAGAHRVEIRAPGFETVTFDVMISPGETVTYKGDMKRVQ